MLVLCSIHIYTSQRPQKNILYPYRIFIITWIGVRLLSQTMQYTDCMLDIFVQEKNCQTKSVQSWLGFQVLEDKLIFLKLRMCSDG
jgi:hypothetical protein